MNKPLHPIVRPIGHPCIGEVRWLDRFGAYVFVQAHGQWPMDAADLRAVAHEVDTVNAEALRLPDPSGMDAESGSHAPPAPSVASPEEACPTDPSG